MEALEDDTAVKHFPASDSSADRERSQSCSPSKSDNFDGPSGSPRQRDANDAILNADAQRETYPTKEQIALDRLMEQEEHGILRDIQT